MVVAHHSTIVTDIVLSLFFFFNDTATTEIYTLSLHDALPIWSNRAARSGRLSREDLVDHPAVYIGQAVDRKSTRLNSSHSQISYAVFCLKKKKREPGRHGPP